MANLCPGLQLTVCLFTGFPTRVLQYALTHYFAAYHWYWIGHHGCGHTNNVLGASIPLFCAVEVYLMIHNSEGKNPLFS
jgi:hypothetical protein